jgi:hypothetical protein
LDICGGRPIPQGVYFRFLQFTANQRNNQKKLWQVYHFTFIAKGNISGKQKEIFGELNHYIKQVIL